MKHNPGSLIKLYLLLAFTALMAEGFSYDFKLSKSDPYVKEAVILTLDINQTNHDVVMLFGFELKKSKAYFFQRLDVQESDTHHNTKVHYTYLLYPLKEGPVNVTFDLVKKVTNDESVAYSFSGDRDNVKTLVTKDTQISLPPLTLNVQSLPKGTLLVGDFTLSSEFKRHEANIYEPLPFQVTIKGQGYPPLLETLLPKSEAFTLFEEKAIVKSTHTKEATQSSVLYPMALSASKSFDLDPVNIEAFNPKTKKSYTLTVPGQHFSISEEDASLLVDKNDNPAPFSRDWSWLTTLLGYLVVFGAGFLTALVWRGKKRMRRENIDPLKEKITSCKTPKALLQLLMATDSKRFVSIIEKLENGLYQKGKIEKSKIDLKKLKEEAEEKL